MNNYKSVIQNSLLINLIVILCLILVPIKSYSQPNKRTNHWYFTVKIGLDFNSGSLQENTLCVDSLAYGGSLASTISDTNGNLLFYSNGYSIWNREHDLIQDYVPGTGFNVGRQGALCMPKPGSDNLFYVFTMKIPGCNYPMFYYTIDMNGNNGLGEVVDSVILEAGYDAASFLTSSYMKNKQDYWIVTRKYHDNKYAAFKVTSQGVDPNPVLSDAPIRPINNSELGKMNIAYNKKYLVCSIIGSNSYATNTEICRFDNETGDIEFLYGFRLLDILPGNPNIKTTSCEFSPCSKYVYISGRMPYGEGSHVYQFDMQYVEDLTLFTQSAIEIGSPKGYNLQLASDGKIYCFSDLSDNFPQSYENIVGVIRSPQKKGANCSYQPNAIQLTHGEIRNELINLPPDFLYRFDFDGICENDVFSFDPWFFPEPVFMEWNFDDPASGANNTSTIPHATHVFSDGGIYEVSVYVEYPSGRIEETSREVEVEYSPEPDLGPDTTVCSGQEVVLDAECGPHLYSWSTGQFGVSQITVSDSGWYWVRVQSEAGCFAFDSIYISFYPPAIADTNNLVISPTTCGGSIGAIRGIEISGNPPFQYQWVDDLGNPIANTIDIFHLPVGNYTLQVTDGNGCLTEFGPYAIYDAGDVLIQEVDYTQEHCGQQDGSIIITATSGLSTMLFYSIDNGSTYYTNQGIFTALPAGTYAVRVKDSTDCQDVYINNPIIIENIPGPQVTDVQITSASVGQNNGAINIFASGNSDTLFYSNDNGANFQINDGLFTNLFPGFYVREMQLMFRLLLINLMM
jgi:hypothetical protein